MTTREVADQFRIHPSTVRRWAADGRLREVPTPGRGHRYRRDDIEAIVAADKQEAAAAS
jgi:excisionase family DNA binding protein